MRFKQNINEEEDVLLESYIRLIKNNCQPWLKQTKYCNGFFYRGVKTGTWNSPFVKKITRKDRNPMNTSIKYTKKLDDIFQKKFGWKPRTTGVFITSDKDEAKMYGLPYIFFAIGNFKYLWAEEIQDSFTDLPHIKYEWLSLKNKRYTVGELDDDEFLDWFTDKYMHKNLCKAMYKYNEVMVKCEQYYLLKTNRVKSNNFYKLLYE